MVFSHSIVYATDHYAILSILVESVIMFILQERKQARLGSGGNGVQA